MKFMKILTSMQLWCQTPRTWPSAIRGLINHRKLPDGAKEYKVLFSDETVLWQKEEQLQDELVQQYEQKREERRQKRKKAEMNQANTVAKKKCSSAGIGST